MASRVCYPEQDVRKMCKQAERDHESKKLVLLMERLKRQIAERDAGVTVGAGKKSLEPVSAGSAAVKLPIRSVPLER